MDSSASYPPLPKNKLGWAGVGMCVAMIAAGIFYFGGSILSVWGFREAASVLSHAGDLSLGGFLYSLGWFARDKVGV